MKTILIVYHSLTGGTRQMADAAARGAEAQTAGQVHLLQAREAGPNDVLNADGYIFATPENLAAMAGIMKDFFDRTYYPVLDQINGRPYAVLICAGRTARTRRVRLSVSQPVGGCGPSPTRSLSVHTHRLQRRFSRRSRSLPESSAGARSLVLPYPLVLRWGFSDGPTANKPLAL